MTIIQKRQPAKKFWIADVLNAEQKTNEAGYKCYKIRDGEATRVNLIAGVVDKYENDLGNYTTLTLDDGTAQIRVKAWNEDVEKINTPQIGDIVLIIGRINQNDPNGEMFIRPEIAKTLEITWLEARLAEMKKKYLEPLQVVRTVATEEQAPQPIVEQVFDEQPKGVPLATREKIIQAIESSDDANGADISSVIKKSGVTDAEAQVAINELIREGEAYQPKQGHIKLL